MSLDITSLGLGGPKSARPVVVGDTLSFNVHPDKFEDLMECVIRWTQNWEARSEKYMVFKATNVTAGDTDPLVPVFVQSSYYDSKFSGTLDDTVAFEVTEEWQYGQSDKTGADRFVVLHNQENKPYQHRFAANLLAKLDNLVHDALCAAGHADIADKLENITETFFGEYLHSYNSVVVQSGDILLVPSELTSYSFGTLKNIEWRKDLIFHESGEYYNFTVPNQTQKGQDILFFIQKEWWDSGSTSDNHISRIATKNKAGQYEFEVDARSQYGQTDQSGKHRWVVYHDKSRDPGQQSFINSMLKIIRRGLPSTLFQTKVVAGIFGLEVENDLEKFIKSVEDLFADHLHTFPN
ncbi:hypothetical protein FRC12_020721 [Ceratobasidium sp. 428]|nr:hypothetical protein FRC12_020721 [Ceratobasidium sp. 428]